MGKEIPLALLKGLPGLDFLDLHLVGNPEAEEGILKERGIQ